MSAPHSNPDSDQPSADIPDDHNSGSFQPERARNVAGEILTAGTVVAHRFALKRLIGKGGMGVVWEVHDKTLGRDVALKFLGAEIASDLEAVTDLQRETLRSLELTHPNIVRVYDYIEDDEFQLVGISMELLTGQSLQTLKLQQPKWVFKPEMVRPWLRQICAALDYAHQTVGVVHRDLKPGNIFINDRGTLKIVDFGVAMVVRESTSRVVQEARLSRSGTLTYMSPQQLRGDKPTSADDWYSIGALLYELFTGKPPFFRGDPHALMLQVITHHPLSITQRQAEMGVAGIQVPPSWERAIMACLAKEAEGRPKSGAVLLAMIEDDRPLVEESVRPGASAAPFAVEDIDKTVMQLPPLAKPSPRLAHPLLCRPPIKKELGLNNFSETATKPAAAVGGPRQPKGKRGGLIFAGLALIAVMVAAALFRYLPLEQKRDEPKLLPPPAPPAPPVITGLTLKVDPADANAQIQIDDRLPTVVPANGHLLVRDLSNGEHIIFAQAAGYESFKTRTVLRNNHGELEIGLAPLRGSVEVTARPGSRVIVRQADGTEAVLGQVGPSGKTTFTDRVRLGETVMRLEHPDCLPMEFRRFSVVADQTTKMRADQKLLPGSLTVATEPGGADIFIDGRRRGREPAELNDVKAEAEIQVEARLEGYEVRRQTYMLRPREHRELTFQLQAMKGDLVVSGRPGTSVVARRSGQAAIELGSIGASGEETFSRRLVQGHWTLVFDHADCRPTPALEVDIDQARLARVSPKQIPLNGSLEIRSQPSGAEIWIQGAKQGTTPSLIESLPAEAPISVELRLRGRTPVAHTVTLKPRERSTLFVDKFIQEFIYARVDVQPWEQLRGHRITFGVDGAPAAPRSSVGSVMELRLDAGSDHSLKVQAEGFGDRSITIDATENRVYRVLLDALPARVSISSDPSGALIWLNGVGPRESPTTFADLAPGHYTMRVQKHGYNPHVQEVIVGAGDNLTIRPIRLSSSTDLIHPSPVSSELGQLREIPTTTPPPKVFLTPDLLHPSVISTKIAQLFNPAPPMPPAPPAIPASAQIAETIKLSGHTRTEYILNVIRGTALARGWSVVKSEDNVVVLNRLHQNYDATLYVRCQPKSVEIFSESYRAGTLGRLKEIPTALVKDLNADLARQLY